MDDVRTFLHFIISILIFFVAYIIYYMHALMQIYMYNIFFTQFISFRNKCNARQVLYNTLLLAIDYSLAL